MTTSRARVSQLEYGQRSRHLQNVRRSFDRRQLNAKVGWVGEHELHRLDCPEYEAAARIRRAVRVGALQRVFVALADDYPSGWTSFPALHACLRAPVKSK